MLSGIYEMGKSVREYIDQNGGGGGGAGGSSTGGAAEDNSYLKSFVETFTGKLPDAIIVSDDNPRIYDLRSVITTQNPHIIQYHNGQDTSGGVGSKQFTFNDDALGSINNGLTITNHTLHPDDSNLQDIINNGRALYFGGGGGSTGGGGATSAINQIQENIDNIPLIGDGVQIPDAILIKDVDATTTNGHDHLIQVDFAGWINVHDANGDITSQHFAYETNNHVSKRWYIRFDSTDGSHISHSEDQHVKKEFNSIQEYISNDRALYFGGGGGDAGTSTGGRGNLDVLKNNLENFQHTLPDSIVVPWASEGYEATFDLFAVRPASASTPPTTNSNWDIYYTCGRGHTDGELMFTDDADGTLITAQANIDQTPGGDFEAGTLTLKWLIDNGRAFYAGGTSDSGGGSSSNYEFCKAFAAAGETFTHSEKAQNKINLDSNSLTQESQNWLHTDTTLNVVGIKIPEGGLYNLNANLNPNRSDITKWQQDVLNLNGRLRVLRANGTDEVLANSQEAKTTSTIASNGALLTVDFSLDNVYLEQNDFIYMEASAWLVANKTTQHGIDETLSYISVSKSGGGGGGGGGGGSSSFGLIASKMDGINFTGELPDIIFQKDQDGLEAALILQHESDALNKIQYAANTAGTNRILRFDNSATAGNMTNNGTWTLGSNSPGSVSVQHFIDTDKAAYLGGGGGGSSTFADLTDTPSSFVGESGKFVKVNDAEDALEFTTFNVNDALGLQEVDGEDNCSEFHLQSDKTANSSAFEDSSVNNYSILGSNVIHSTSNPKVGFGSSSIQFNGNGQLLVADGSAFKFFHTKIIKNYTIQLWIFKDALNTREPLLLTAANNNEHGIRLIVDSDNKVKFDVMKGLSNATGLSLASASTVSAQTWHHIAIVNENNTMTLYLDGNQEQSLAWTSDASTITPNFGLSIGAGPMGAGQAMVFFNGRMQDIRVDKIAFRSDLLPPTSLLNATCDPSAGKSNIDFKMLRDTPVNYSNAGGKYVKVKDGEDGVEFVEISVGSSTTNEFSTAYVTQDQTSDGFITDLEFGNLVVGRTYRISSTICFESNDASALSRADFYNGTQRIVSLYNKGLTSTVSNSMLFVASDSSISVSGNGLTSNNFIHGLPELSFVQLELPPSVVVEIEDIPVAPVAPPGGGIFSVNDVKMHAGIIDYQDSSNTFSDIDSNAFGGNIIDISDIRLISKIDNTGDQKTFEDLDSRLTSIDKLDLADVRVIAQIDHTGHSRTFEDFDSSLTSFGVLSFADMIINTKIYSTGTDSVMTTDPYTSHDHSFSWTGIN